MCLAQLAQPRMGRGEAEVHLDALLHIVIWIGGQGALRPDNCFFVSPKQQQCEAHSLIATPVEAAAWIESHRRFGHRDRFFGPARVNQADGDLVIGAIIVLVFA
jgi:hypothetical protein